MSATSLDLSQIKTDALASASSFRSLIGLGTLATQSATITDYLTIASAASTYQPLDSDLTSIAALSTTAFGRGLLTESSATTARTTLGLGSSAVLNAGSANGVATLGTDSKLTAAQIPDISLISYLGSVASQAAMLALSGQQGDWCVRSDLSTTWVITGSDPTLLANWTQLSYPSVPVQSVFGRTGNVVGVSTDYSSVGITNTAIGASNPSTGAFTTLSTTDRITTPSILLSGNFSATAWTTNGVGLSHTARTLTDTSSTGTVATAYTNVLGGNTIAASNATTFTDYASLFLGSPSAGSNVTITNPFSLICQGAVRIGGQLSLIQGTANTSVLTSTGYSLTGSNAQSLMDLSGTWNTTGTPTALKLNVTDTASNAASLLMDLQVGGSSRVTIDKNGRIRNITTGSSLVNATDGGFFDSAGQSGWSVAANRVRLVHFVTSYKALFGTGGMVLVSNYAFGWSSSTTSPESSDLILVRDAAQTLAQRNGTSAQAFRVYNTYTDANNYERAKIAWESNVLRIGTEKAGTGSARALELQTDGTTRLTISTTGAFTIANALDIAVGTTNGTKIGTATNQKLGFFNATPVVQPTAVADATDAASVITQLNALLSRMRDLGLIAT